MRTGLRILGAAALMVAAGCNNSISGFSGAVGNTPNGPPSSTFIFTSSVSAETFYATVADPNVSWLVPLGVQVTPPPVTGPASTAACAATPAAPQCILNVVLLNNSQPTTACITDLGPASGTPGVPSLSVGICTGTSSVCTISKSIASTLFTTTTFPAAQCVTTASKPVTPPIKTPAANPDVRLFINGPAGINFGGLIEDTATGFDVSISAPAWVMFENPNGKVDAQLQFSSCEQGDAVSMYVNGALAVSAACASSVTIVEP